jgi:hypothetical protein
MDRVIAFIANPYTTNINALNKVLNKYKELDEIVLFDNGCKLFDLNNITSDRFQVTTLSTEIQVPFDRVLRQIFSYVHQTRSEGTLVLLDVSDSIPDSDLWLDYCDNGHSTKIVKSDMELYKDGSKFYQHIRFNASPFNFIPIIDISNLPDLLTSRTSGQFLNKLMNYDYNSYINFGSDEWSKYKFIGSVPDLIQLNQWIGVSWLLELETNLSIESRKVLDYINNYELSKLREDIDTLKLELNKYKDKYKDK